MTIDTWWPQLSSGTRDWLIANNGSPVPPAIVEQIELVGGPGAADPWWGRGEDATELLLPDQAVDWIEAVANGESPPPP
ncbi:hypothetical protein [Ornithinimicrobium cerasi]|uniref:Uncharacterized protein n=1 Tax=Ornithinimicrobium cerasi TaxID=2248773 RepID=A0A285VWN3_9MICO|nr:hypothetical protein [Ornithinimicrobium cerasi]SOC57666.1 hypothetical protein SAMN05421879_1158 [Ornithinimicrobium cerasi]